MASSYTYPPVFITHAQNGEDVLLWRALKDVQKGYYIDVGAQDPVADSVTKAFYERGWHGINIEPMPHWYERLVADRPHDTNLQVAVADKPGELKLFEVEGTGLSTSEPEFAHRHEASGYMLKERVVECVTLDEICAGNDVGVVHFLKIDCEGAERAVLQGFSFTKVRPWIVLVEATEPNSMTPTWSQWEDLLTGRAYQFVFFDGLNRYYVAEEHSDLADAFNAPVNVFDNAHRASEVAAQDQIDLLQKENDALKDSSAKAVLQERLTESTGQCNALRQRLDALTIDRDTAAAQIRASAEALQVIIPALQAEHVEWASRADAEKSELAARIEAVTAERDAARARAETDYEVLQGQVDVASAERSAAMDRESALQLQLVECRKQLAHTEKLRSEQFAHAEERWHELLSSRSWRFTAPMRGGSRACRRMYLRSRKLGYEAVRPVAHMLRPVLRWSTKSMMMRRTATFILGRNSRTTSLLRLFLFGAPPAPSPDVFAADRPAEPAVPTKPAINDNKYRLSDPARVDGRLDPDAEMERVRTELAARYPRVALSADELMRRVRSEVAQHRM